MKITRIESLVFGVEDVATSARYYDDWGLKRVDHGVTGVDYELPSGQTLKLRQAGDAALPAPVEAGSTLRECVWGVDNNQSLDEIGAELGKDQKLKRDADGTLHAQDPWGMPIAFQVEKAKAVPGASRMNKPFMPVEHVTPTRMGHVVFFVPKDRAREISDFYTDRLQFRLSDRSGGLRRFHALRRRAGSSQSLPARAPESRRLQSRRFRGQRLR